MTATATIITLPKRSAAQLQCSSCGAGAEGACDCGAPYVPVAQRAAEAIAKNPEKSDRAIAAELGVSKTSVLKARKAGGHQGPPERVGKDGKSYPAKTRKPVAEDDEDEHPEFTDADSYRAAILVRVDGALTMARNVTWAVENDPADITRAVAREPAQAVRNAAKAWCALADRLEQST